MQCLQDWCGLVRLAVRFFVCFPKHRHVVTGADDDDALLEVANAVYCASARDMALRLRATPWRVQHFAAAFLQVVVGVPGSESRGRRSTCTKVMCTNLISSGA